MFQGIKKQNYAIKVGKSNFAVIRQPRILPVTNKDHVCVCPRCENFETRLDGMKKLIPKITSSSDLLKMTVCEDPWL